MSLVVKRYKKLVKQLLFAYSELEYVDEVLIYDTESDLLEILDTVEWDVRILGDEYQDKDFTGREKYLEKCYFNKRPHTFSSSELRKRVADKEFSD